MIVIDSSVWIDYFNGVENKSTLKFEKHLDESFLIVPDLIKIEVLQGFSLDRDYRTAKKLLEGFHQESILDPEIAEITVHHYRSLRKKGITIRKTIDMIIGTFCSVRGYGLLHNDSDFDQMSQIIKLKIV